MLVMMESPEAISVKVEALLGDISALKIKRNDNSADPKKATNIQCEIHQKFVIIDWIKSLASGLQLKDDETVELDKTWAKVSAERVDAKATKDDLKEMRIVEPFKETGNEHRRGMEANNELKDDPFPFMDLPELLVREKVLSYLTHPQDKLNMLEVMPSARQLMKWDRTTLHFELVLPILTAHSLENWNDLCNLSRVAPFSRDLIKKDYEQKVLQKLERFPLPQDQGTRSVKDILKQVSGEVDYPPWARSSIFPCRLELDFCSSTAEEQKELMTGLEKVGGRICHCILWLALQRSPRQALEKLAMILSRLPQLTTLMLTVYDLEERENDSGEIEEWQWEDIDDVDFPDLRSLRNIVWDDEEEQSHHEFVKRALLENYGGRLHQLLIYSRNDKHPPCSVWDSNPKIDCPHLSTLKLYWSQGKLQDVLFDLNMLAYAPLKTIHLKLDYKKVFQKGFPELLILLGRHFGKTLEKLELPGGSVDDGDDDDNRPDPPGMHRPTWMLDLKFPNLKRLKVSGSPRPHGWNFLLLFPGLEKLSLHDVGKSSEVDFEGDENMLGLSLNRKEMLTANIWKLLPNLDEYSNEYMITTPFGASNIIKEVLHCNVKRRECLWFQQQN